MDRLRRAVTVTVLVVLSISVLGAVLPWTGWRMRDEPGAVLITGVALTAAVLCALTGRRGHFRRSRLSWYLHSAACVSWALGPMSIIWYGMGSDPVSARPDLLAAGRALFIVLELAAIWATSRSPDGRARLRLLLDGVVAACAVFVVAWAVFFGGTWHDAAEADRGMVAVGMVWALSDLVLVTFYAILFASEFPAGRRRAPGLILGGLTALACADAIYSLQLTLARPSLVPSRVGWTLTFALFALAALSYRGTTPRRDLVATSRFASYGPYGLIAPAALTYVVQFICERTVPVPEIIAGFILFLAVLARQLIVLADNRGLVGRLAASERILLHRAAHDALTGLGNRSMLTAQLEEALHARQGRPIRLLFLDLDDFKEVNDSLGHLAGDALLTLVADRLRGALRSSDIVVRLGGDEFAVLIKETERDTRMLARRVLGIFREPFLVADRRLAMGASIGLVEVEGEDSRNAMELLRDADIAMYAAKQRGKNDIQVFTPGLHHTTSHELELRAALLATLDEGGLDVAYQPIAEATGGQIVGVEALARWTHPTLGPVPAERFVAIAERAHISRRITAAVLDRACRDLRRWIEAGAPEPLRMSVNVVAAELADPELPSRLRRALKRHGLTGDRLIIEITETALMHDIDTVAQAIRRIQELGISLAIDDFGTGYSSLARLGHFSVESLKIDKLFVEAVLEPRGRDMVAAIVALARSCRMRTVAEGVEHEDQLTMLRTLGCDMIQGYLLSRPVPAREVLALLKSTAAEAAKSGVS